MLSLDEISNICVKCKDLSIWLEVSKYFHTLDPLIMELLRSKVQMKVDKKFFSDRVNYGYVDFSDENHFITLCTYFHHNLWVESYHCGIRYRPDSLSEIFINDLHTVQLCNQCDYIHLEIDVVSYSAMIRNRASKIGIINRDVIRTISDEYFTEQLSFKSEPVDVYLLCMMTLRMMGVKIDFDLDINDMPPGSSLEQVQTEWDRLNYFIDNSSLIKQIRKRIRKL